MTRRPSYDDAAERQREKDLYRLGARVHELAVSYSEGYADGPGLLAQLAHPCSHLAPVEKLEGKPAGKPGSRPTPRLDLLDLAEAVRQDALFFAYRAGWTGVDPIKALKLLPDLLADADADELARAASQFSIYVGTCRTALGYRGPSKYHPHVTCPYCAEHTIYSRPEECRGWCGNPECPGDPDTRMRAEWSRLSLLALIQEDNATQVAQEAS